MKHLWKPKDAAAYLAVTTTTLNNWRERGTGPRYVRLSNRAVRYRPADVEAWLKDNEANAA